MANFIQKANKRMEQKGTKGLFTRKAKAAGMGVQEYARHILSSVHASATLKKEASFAKAMGHISKKRSILGQ
jgi:hypothetical protein